MAKMMSVCVYGNDVKATEQPADWLEKCENQAKDKEDELKFFCKMLNHKDNSKVWTWFKKNTDILGKRDQELMKRVIEFLIEFKKHKVDGKIWNNGGFGSRWTDKVDGCRIAFYSKKLDPTIFEGEEMPFKLTKPYLLLIMDD